MIIGSAQEKIFSKNASLFFDSLPVFKNIAADIGESSFFLTGASGLFGAWILNFLRWSCSRKYACPSVTVLSRNELEFSGLPFYALRGDVRDLSIKNFCVDFTLHMAAPSASETFSGTGDLHKFRTLADGTENVLRYASKNTRKRVLVLSSGSIFGAKHQHEFFPISENEQTAPDPSAPNQGLSVGKRVVEFLTRDFSDKGLIDASIARCFTFLGPGLPTELHYAAGNFVSQALFNREIIIKSDGSAVRSFMYLGDLVCWLMTILISGKNCETYNVGSNEKISILDFAHSIKTTLGSEAQITLQPENSVRIGNPPHPFYVPCTAKAREELGLRHYTNLQNGILLYAKYLREIEEQ